GIDTAGHDHAQPPLPPQQGVALLKEQLVGVEVGRALMQEGVRGISKAPVLFALLQPFFVYGGGGLEAVPTAPAQIQVVLLFAILVFNNPITKGLAHVLRPVGHTLEVGVVGNPAVLKLWPVAEILQLFSQGILLAIGAIKRIVVGEELFGVGLLDFPRRIAQQRIKTVLAGGE